ncbi:MAG: HD domain-containing protein [Patescibacteria group bacterium]
MKTNVERADQFLKSAFENNPSYSFGEPSIMYNHSRRVRDMALEIAASVPCDRELLEILALFHDIGKAYDADEQTLRERHDELGYEVTKDFLPQLKLTDEQRHKLVDFLKGTFNSIESTIIKDADIIAFFTDPILQQELKDWGDSRGLPNELQRKAEKISKLSLQASKAIAEPLYNAYIKTWGLENSS